MRTQILTERGKCHGETVHRAGALVQGDGTVGERKGLIVAVPHQGHVGLVAADQREDVFGAGHRREMLGLAQGRHRFVGAARLREHDAHQGVALREVASIAGGVERGDGGAGVLADDRRVADLPVADGELVVGEPDRPRIQRQLGLPDGAAEQGDGARLVTAQRGDPSVQAPHRRQARRGDPFAEHVGRAAQHRGCARDVVAQEPGLRHRAPDRQFVLAADARSVQRLRERVDGLGGFASPERGGGGRHRRLECLGGHGQSIAVRV